MNYDFRKNEIVDKYKSWCKRGLKTIVIILLTYFSAFSLLVNIYFSNVINEYYRYTKYQEIIIQELIEKINSTRI